jgi:hypothetical protein
MSQTLTAQVEAFYSTCAGSIYSNKDAYNERVATAFGYSAEELQDIPDNSNLGLSCGNPLATANLKEVGPKFILSSSHHSPKLVRARLSLTLVLEVD